MCGRLSIAERVRLGRCGMPSGLPRLQSCRLQGCLGTPAYTPAVDWMSRLATAQEMRRGRGEVRGDDLAVAETHLLERPARREGDERKSTVDGDAHVGPGGRDALHAAGEAIERRCRRGLRGAGEEGHVLGPEAEAD